MKLWEQGDLTELLKEGRAIQNRFPSSRHQGNEQQVARSFAKMMFQGKTQAALQLLTDQGKGGLLHLDDPVTPLSTVKDVLLSKHPPSNPASPDTLESGVPQEVHPVVIDAALIRSTALNTKGAAGPSGLDAYTWRRMCSSFKSASSGLCHSIALAAKRLCATLVDPECVAPLLACRLIALDKNPGVRPIGIGDTARRIIAKAAISVLKDDVLDAAGSMQLCVGQMAGVESAIHAARKKFNSPETEAVLLVDASNAFNSLNRKAALHNIRSVCPSEVPMALVGPLLPDNNDIQFRGKAGQTLNKGGHILGEVDNMPTVTILSFGQSVD